MGRKGWRGTSSVEAAVLRQERRQEIRRLSTIRSAQASVGGPVRHVVTPAELADLREMEREHEGPG